MPEIRHQQPNASPEIELGEIHIPDDQDWGTGVKPPGRFGTLVHCSEREALIGLNCN